MLLLLLYKCCLSCYAGYRGDTDIDTLSENFQAVAVITTTTTAAATATTTTKYCLTTFIAGLVSRRECVFLNFSMFFYDLI